MNKIVMGRINGGPEQPVVLRSPEHTVDTRAQDYCRRDCLQFVAELVRTNDGRRVAVGGCSLCRKNGVLCSSEWTQAVMQSRKPGPQCPNPHLK